MMNLQRHLRTLLGRTLLGSTLPLAVASSARAEEPQEVWVELSDCSQPPYDATQLSRSLALELSTYRLQVHLHESAPADATHVRLLLSECDAGADSLLLRWETPDGPPRHRALSLRDVPWPARARALALLISDVLRPPRWTEGETTAQTEPEPAPAPTRDPLSLLPMTADPVVDMVEIQRSNPYSRPLSAYVTGAIQASWVPRVSLLLYGLGLGLQGEWFEPVEWAIEGAYSGGRGKLEDELFEIDWWNVGVGLDYNLAAERRLQVGPRLSVVHVSGFSTAQYADDFSGSTAQLGGRVRLSPRLSTEAASLDLLLDASYPLLTLGNTAAAEPVPWTAWVVTMGVGLSLEL